MAPSSRGRLLQQSGACGVVCHLETGGIKDTYCIAHKSSNGSFSIDLKNLSPVRFHVVSDKNKLAKRSKRTNVPQKTPDENKEMTDKCAADVVVLSQ